MNVYIISGLGADKRAFQNIKLPDFCVIKHVEWLIPIQNESLTDYSLRMAEDIDTKAPFVLIGLSFGGIIVTELSKILNPVKSIIISSISTRKQLPWYFKAIGMLGLHKIIPTQLFKMPNPLSNWLFGIKTKEEKDLLLQILKDIDKKYLRWSINEILTWKNNSKPKVLFHIHGTMDNMLPIRYIKPDIRIDGGRHLMLISMADIINEILESELMKIKNNL